MMFSEVNAVDQMEAKARARRQARVAKIVWGTFFLTMGVLFMLHDMGRIDLGEPLPELGPERAVDGDDKTRWSSCFRDPQWLAVDLGTETAIGRVRLNWEAAYAKDYELQVSNDGTHWTTAKRVRDGTGGVEDQDVNATARYVRMMGTRRATPYGYSLWELQVFDSAGTLLSQGKAATASSVEDRLPFLLWLRFWPLVLVATGLPLLIAPRDDASQVFGMVLTAGGTALQLHVLGVIPWGFRQTGAAVLIVVGLVILVQSQRRGERNDESGPGRAGGGS
jgi:hypothetical protein